MDKIDKVFRGQYSLAMIRLIRTRSFICEKKYSLAACSV